MIQFWLRWVESERIARLLSYWSEKVSINEVKLKIEELGKFSESSDSDSWIVLQ